MSLAANSSWIQTGAALAGVAAAVLAFYLQRRHLLSTKSKVRIGINRFPDSLPILYAAQRGYFAPLDVDIHFLNWPQAYDSLFNGTVDMIFGLKRISAALGVYAGRDDLNDGNILCLYQGFSILLPPKSDIRSWVEIQAEGPQLNDSSIESVVKRALKQLNGRTICVMSWDTRDATKRLLSYANAEARYIDSYDVEGDFEAFVAGTSPADAFVGGVTQRLIGTHHRRCKELISEQHVQMGLVEKAGLVWQDLPDSVVRTVESGWFKAVSELGNDENARRKFVALMNTYCLPNSESKKQFSLDDFRAFWNHWEQFASDAAESKNLQKQRVYNIDIPSSTSPDTDFLTGSNILSMRPRNSVGG